MEKIVVPLNLISLPNNSVTHSDRKKEEKKSIVLRMRIKKITCYQFENFLK